VTDIPEELVNRMMVKCGRRCCICRRFRPTKLQVHHITERSKGGGNDEDNLIVTCLPCHTDVHSKVPFARRFTVEELKGHRDALVRMVEQGTLPTADTDDADEVMLALLRAPSRGETALCNEAVELLLQAATAEGPDQGSVMVIPTSEGLTVQAGGKGTTVGHDERRKQARYNRAVHELEAAGLLERCSDCILDVTDAGYLAADEILVNRACSSASADHS
jgi:hypothetical protein